MTQTMYTHVNKWIIKKSSNKNGQKTFADILQKNTEMASKYMKRCSTSLGIKKCKLIPQWNTAIIMAKI
jgi:hypothetical protein